MIKAGDADMLGHDDVIPDSYGTGQHAADADHDVVPDGDVADTVVDADKVFDDRSVADLKLPEGHYVNSGGSSDDGAFSPLMNEGVDKNPYPPARSSFSPWHQQVDHE
jgi:hypothetical protein